MTDLHTHILPGIDDGAPDTETSLEMLRQEAAQQVDTVYLTPHFYRRKERPESFLQRRLERFDALNEAVSALPAQEQHQLPKYFLGAEVAWLPGLTSVDGLEQMCLADTDFLLLELPFEPWSGGMLDQLYDLQNVLGITPVLAHFERYLAFQKKDIVKHILEMDLPIQIGTDSLLSLFGKKLPMKLLREGNAQIVATDCHNLTSRPPNLGAAMEKVRQRFGADFSEHVAQAPERLLYE